MQDREVAKNFQRALTKQGLKWKLGHKCNKAEREGDIVKLHVENAKSGKQEVLEANIVLVAAGELPAMAGTRASPARQSMLVRFAVLGPAPGLPASSCPRRQHCRAAHAQQACWPAVPHAHACVLA